MIIVFNKPLPNDTTLDLTKLKKNYSLEIKCGFVIERTESILQKVTSIFAFI